MKILKSLSKKIFLITSIFFFVINSFAEEKPSDIWNITETETQKNLNKKETSQKNENENEKNLTNSIYEMQPKNLENQITFDQNLISDEVKIFGLYDPEDNGLDINMWSNTDGDQLKNIFKKLKKIRQTN